MNAEPTLDLLRRLRDGDRGALDHLIERNLEPLRRWAQGRMPARARDLRDTVDLVQDTLMAALPHLESFQYHREGDVQAYLRMAILNRIRNEHRRAGRRPLHGELESQLPGSEPSPLDEAVGADVLEDYEAGLARLSEADRTLVILRLELGYEYDAIAEATERASAEAARVATSRAILKLAEAMEYGP